MATQTLATADAILKDLYRGPIIEQLNYKTFMLDMIERDSDHVDFTGRRAIYPVHSSGNPSRTSIADGGTLPTPGIQGYQDAIINIRYHSSGMELTDQVIKQAQGNEGAFVNILTNDSQLLAKDMRKNINRQVWGTGTGLLATLTSSPAAATTFTVDASQYLKVGDTIDVLNKTTGVGTASVVVTAVNRTTKTITVSAAITATTTTDGVYLAGARNLEMDVGLRVVAATGRTLHGINSATAGNEFWNGFQRDAASAVAGEGIFEQLIDDVGAGGQGEVEVVVTTRGIRRRLADTYSSTKRFNDAKAVQIHGGYTAIYVNEVPVIADDDAPKGWAFALRKDAFKWFELEAPDWLSDPKSGQIWQLASGSVSGTRRAAWNAWFNWYASLGCIAPNRVGAIVNAADDSSG